MERLLLVTNTKSGLVQRDQEIEKGITFLKEKGFKVVTVLVEDMFTKEGFDKKVAQYTPATIIVVGGDGTVNLLSQYLVVQTCVLR